MNRRAYRSSADAGRMLALVRRCPAGNLHTADLPYRLSSWAFDYPANVSLWEDETGALLGWAALQPPFWTIDYAFDPAAGQQMHRDILAWADERARVALGTDAGRPAWYVNVFPGQRDRIADLEAAGFASQEKVEYPWSKVLLVRPARLPVPDHPLPRGYTLRPLVSAAQADMYVDLHRAVFESKNMTRSWRERIVARPDYDPNLNLLAVDADGNLAGFCICWYAESGPGGGPTGQVEPMGVAAEHRGRRLGQALLAEGIRRLHAAGAQQVLVETDTYRNPARRLYRSLGFTVLENVLVYRKDYEP